MPKPALRALTPLLVAAAICLGSAGKSSAGGANDVLFGFSTAKVVPLLIDRKITEMHALIAQTPRHPGDDDYRKILEAATLAANQDYERAVVIFDQTRGLPQAPSQIQILAAKSYGNLIQYPKAIAYATMAIKQAHEPDAYRLRAGCYMAQNHFVAAASDYEAMAALEPGAAPSHIAKAAKALVDANKAQEGLNLIDKYMASKGSRSAVMLGTCRALCLERLGRNQEAAEVISRELDNVNKKKDLGVFERCSYLTSILEERAKCYDKLGQKSKAAADREQVKKLTRDTFEETTGK